MTKKNPKSCVVITTINKETEALRRFAKNPDYNLIIVGDKKSPESYSLDASYLDVESQKKLFGKLADLLPYNHYSRKNIGYLEALKNGYEIIADSDDDNIPEKGWGVLPPDKKHDLITAPKFPNVYSLFTSEKIWPRGYSLNLITKSEKISLKKEASKVMVWQGLVNGDPDVDAIHRLVFNKEIDFKKRPPVVLQKGIVSAFNSQNTLWHREALLYTYLPHTVSFRYTDILRSFVAQYGIWAMNGRLGFHEATARQIRNEHNLMKDFESEYEMYISFQKVIDALEKCELTGEPKDLLTMYTSLSKIGVVDKKELATVKEWITQIKKLTK